MKDTIWKLRTWLHRRIHGHQPIYFTYPGALSGNPYVACQICDDDAYTRQRAKEAELHRRFRRT